MLARRLLDMTWAEFWDGAPAAVIDAQLGTAMRMQGIEATRDEAVQAALKTYMAAYGRIINSARSRGG